MKVSVFSTYDINGGAAIATYRLHRALRGIGVDSTMVVQRKFSDDPTVDGPGSTFGKIEGLIRPQIDRLPVRRYRNRGQELFSVGMLPDHVGAKIAALNPDIVHFF
ncbi:MAG: glycosyl transferase, partial [Pseudomonadota bacterium]